jgi:hypothetical protein
MTETTADFDFSLRDLRMTGFGNHSLQLETIDSGPISLPGDRDIKIDKIL